MTEQAPAYGLSGLVLINSAIFILFAYSFFKPQTSLADPGGATRDEHDHMRRGQFPSHEPFPQR